MIFLSNHPCKHTSASFGIQLQILPTLVRKDNKNMCSPRNTSHFALVWLHLISLLPCYASHFNPRATGLPSRRTRYWGGGDWKISLQYWAQCCTGVPAFLIKLFPREIQSMINKCLRSLGLSLWWGSCLHAVFAVLRYCKY